MKRVLAILLMILLLSSCVTRYVYDGGDYEARLDAIGRLADLSTVHIDQAQGELELLEAIINEYYRRLKEIERLSLEAQPDEDRPGTQQEVE